jgi:hypothetical protein
MCCRYSVGDDDIFRLVQDARSDVRAKRLACEYFHTALERFLKELANGQEIVKCLLSRAEIYEIVNVAVLVLRASCKGAEQGQPLDAIGA